MPRICSSEPGLSRNRDLDAPFRLLIPDPDRAAARCGVIAARNDSYDRGPY